MINTDQFSVVLATEFAPARSISVYIRGGSLVASVAQESVIRSFR
jgi:hypothetical protein